MTQTAITPRPKTNTLALAGQVANDIAARSVFTDYQSRKAKNTLRRQANDLALFADFLRVTGLQVGDFGSDPETWRGVTWGLVEGFARWQLQEGYAVPSVNVRLATVKSYARLALKAGALTDTEYALIRSVQGSSHKETKRIDEQRQAAELPTRKGSKKSAAVSIDPEQAEQLKTQPETPQGRRDALLMCLLLDHGLRVGEVVLLEVNHFDLKAETLTFYCPKVLITAVVKCRERSVFSRAFPVTPDRKQNLLIETKLSWQIFSFFRMIFFIFRECFATPVSSYLRAGVFQFLCLSIKTTARRSNQVQSCAPRLLPLAPASSEHLFSQNV